MARDLEIVDQQKGSWGFVLVDDIRLADEAPPRVPLDRAHPHFGDLTLSLMDGRAALTLTANAGRQWATHDRPDGDADIYGVTADFGIDVNENLSLFFFSMWEHNGYHDEHLSLNHDLVPVGSYSRSDDLYELEAGLTWTFAPGWSLHPSVRWVRDESNTLWGNYSSTEFLITVRKSF